MMSNEPNNFLFCTNEGSGTCPCGFESVCGVNGKQEETKPNSCLILKRIEMGTKITDFNKTCQECRKQRRK